jgi:predicted nucleotidyltransferase
MSAEQPPTGPARQRIDYDPEAVIASLAGQLTSALVDGARLEAMVRTLAGENAAQAAQLAELRGKTGGATE